MEYNLLRRKVLERDAWRCQICGSSKDLHVHHLIRRSSLGDDAIENLITLCVSCHRRQHGCFRGLVSLAPKLRTWVRFPSPAPEMLMIRLPLPLEDTEKHP